jgi:hypothetical protein
MATQVKEPNIPARFMQTPSLAQIATAVTPSFKKGRHVNHCGDAGGVAVKWCHSVSATQ